MDIPGDLSTKSIEPASNSISSSSEIWPELNGGFWDDLSDEQKLQIQGYIEQGMFSTLLSFMQTNFSIEGTIRNEWKEIMNL